MNKYFVLSWGFMLIGFMFIGLDSIYRGMPIQGEIYEPFIYLSYALWLLFMFMGFMEKKLK